MKNCIGDTPVPFEQLHGGNRFKCLFVPDSALREKEVLDVGCGYGWFELYAVSRQVRAITGVEYREQDLLTARRHLNDPRISLQLGDATRLPFADGSFDTVVSWEVIEHVPKGTEMQMISEIHRVLRPGGMAFLSTPYRSFRGTLLDPAWWLIGHRHYRTETIHRLAREAGFTVGETTVKGGWWQILEVHNRNIAKWIFRRRPFFESALQRRVDREFSGDRGFYTLITAFVKEASRTG